VNSLRHGLSANLLAKNMARRLIAIAILLIPIWLIVFLAFVRPILPNDASHGGQLAVFVGGTLSLFYPASTLIYRLWLAEDQGHKSAIITAISQGISCLCVALIPVNDDWQSLVFVVVYWVLPQILVPLIFLSVRTHADRSEPLFDGCWKYLTNARGYWYFSLASVATLQIDIFFLSAFSTTEALVLYGFYQKIFGFGFGFFTSAFGLIQTKLTLTFINNDKMAFRLLCYKTIALSAVAVLAGGTLLYFFREIVLLVLMPGSETFSPSVLFHSLITFYWIVRAWTDVWAIAVIAQSKSRILAIVGGAQSVVTVFLMLWLVPLLGEIGAIAALLLGFLTTASWILPLSAIGYQYNKANND
jgi:O-antigen/teichoic acid export membrane protein